jgi:hypothetical protein
MRGGGLTAFDFEVPLTPAHCRAGRGWLGWTQIELSRRARVGLTAIRDFENENRKTHRSVQFQLQVAFANAGVWCSEGGIWSEHLVDLEQAQPE